MINQTKHLELSNSKSKRKISHLMFLTTFLLVNSLVTMFYALKVNLEGSYLYQNWNVASSLYNTPGYREEGLVMMADLILKFQFKVLFWIFFAKLLIDIYFELKSRRPNSNFNSFLVYLKTSYSGLPYYQILLSCMLSVYFSIMYITLFRKIDSGITGDWSYLALYLGLNGTIVLITSILAVKYQGQISLDRFVKTFDYVLVIPLLLAWLAISYENDNEGFILIGNIIIFPMLISQILHISKIKQFDPNISITSNVSDLTIASKKDLISIGWKLSLTSLLQLFAIFSFYAQIQEYNTFREPGDELNVFNKYTLLNLIVISVVILLIHLIIQKYRIQNIETWFSRLFYLSFILLLSLFMYDDLYFSISDTFESKGFIFIGELLFLQLPVSILSILEFNYFRNRQRIFEFPIKEN